MPELLVTGGNIGDHVAEELARMGLSVGVLVRNPKVNPAWDKLRIRQIAGDFTDAESLLPAFEGVERFFSVTPFVENLAQLGITTVQAAKKAGVQYIVRASTLTASETGISMGRWHRQVEKAVEDSGIAYTILQPNTFMQSYFSNAESIKAANAFYLPQGEGEVSLVDTRDVAAVAVACLTQPGHEGKTYVVTGAETLSNAEIASKLSVALGRKISYFGVTPEQAEESMLKAGVPAWMTEALLGLFAFCAAGQAAGISPVIEQILQRRPITFDRFLHENAAVFGTDRQAAATA